ncbi:MAG TPA: glycosyltransferase family 4 protein [Bacteroidales bacterium]|jgi:glycosyltransferase involved in cell wall biosynthesis|nr:glycosyltransferase family 4 protein [Bacteroidales bacterium]
MREVFIISTGEILNGKTAGSRRMQNIAKSLTAGGITVYLCSFAEFKGEPSDMERIRNGVFALKTANKKNPRKYSLKDFLVAVNRFLSRGEADKVIYLYPTTFVLKDFIYLIYFKLLKRHRFFCEINELRRAISFSSQPPKGPGPVIRYFLKASKDLIVFSLNEIQVVFYDGITVISTSLEKYFSKYTSKIIRVPILCDAEEIAGMGDPPIFDGDTFKICFAGYIKCEKEGFGLVYEALSRLSTRYNIELYLYGILEEEDKIRLRQLSEKFDLKEKVYYKGNIEPEDLKREFLKYHLLILPRPINKRTIYGFSTKLSEYLVSGIPVLLTDVSDNAMFIKDNYNGYIIPPGSADAIAGKLEEIILSYNDRAQEIVKNAHITVRERLDLRLFTQVYDDFFFSNRKKMSQPA